MIENDRIILRAVEPDDVQRLYEWENDRPTVFDAPLSLQNITDYVMNYRADIWADGQLRLMIVDRASGDTVGCVDLYSLSVNDRRAGTGIYIAAPCRGRGLASAAVEAVAEYASRRLGLHQLWATCAVGNEASRRLFAGRGFRPVGRLRSFIRRGQTYEDVLVMQRLFP